MADGQAVSTSTDSSFAVDLASIAEHVPAVIIVYNVKKNEYVYVNGSIRKLLGYEPAEFINKGISFVSSLIHPEDLPFITKKSHQALEAANRTKKSHRKHEPIVSFEYRMRHKLGHWVWLRTDSSVYHRRPGDSIEHILNVSVDISERKLHTSKLAALSEQLESRYQAFMTNSHEGIWRFELDKPISTKLKPATQVKQMFERAYMAEANDLTAKMYGFTSAEDIVGLRLNQLILKSDPNNIAYLTAFVESGYKLAEVDSHEIDKDGNSKYFRNSLVGFVSGGKLIRAWGTQQDVTEQRKSEEALKTSEERLSLALKASRMGVWEWNIQSGKLTWSKELKKLFGLKASDRITYKKYVSLQHPDDRKKLEHTIQNAKKTGRKYSMEHRVVWPDGSIHWILGKGQAFMEDGKVVRMAGMSLDIDDRKKTEDILRRQNEYLEALNETALEISNGMVDQLSILKVILKWAGRIAKTPHSYVYLLSGDGAEMTVNVTNGLFKQHIGHTIEKGEGLAGRVWKTGKPLTVKDYDVWRGRQANFPKGFLRAGIGIPLRSDQKTIGVIALGYRQPKRSFAADKITALTRLADLASIALDNARLYQESQEREKRFRILADSAPVLIWMSGPDKLFTYVNKPWLRFTGHKLEEDTGNGWQESVHNDDLVLCRDRYTNAFDAHEPFKIEYRLRRHDGQYRWVLNNGIPRYSPKGEFLGYIGSCIDIHDLKSTTKRKQELEMITASLTEQRQQLVALNNAKDEFISLASHQLRTPATGVKQFIGMLLEGYFGELGEEQREMLAYAYESNERQLQVINDLLKVAQVDAGKIVLTKERTEIVDLIQDVLQEQEAQFRKRRQRVIFNQPKRKIYTVIDRAKIRMVLENLIDNAGKYTPEGKDIAISIEAATNSPLIIRIADEGVGISKKDMTRLFQKFSRLDNPLSIQVGGTGLGLYWAKQIIDMHQGVIDVESKKGVGSTFTVRIPS